MAINVQSNSVGLCPTCNNSPVCVYRKMRGFDALFCEMFDGYGFPREGEYREGNPAPPRGATRAEPRTPAAETLTGLCSNCENRNECTYPRPEGGVWHCEEYR